MWLHGKPCGCLKGWWTLSDRAFHGAGALAEEAAGIHPQARVKLSDSTHPFPAAQSFNPFGTSLGMSAFQAAASGLTLGTGCPSLSDELVPGSGRFKQAGSASTLQSSMTGTAFGSEPVTPTGVPPFLTRPRQKCQ